MAPDAAQRNARPSPNLRDAKPFRADHVGSLIRPAKLLAARKRLENGEITPAELRAIEDECIRDAVAKQESLGLRAITDGEFRRSIFHIDFLSSFEGLVQTKVEFSVPFKGAGGAVNNSQSGMVVADKIRRPKPIAVEDFSFLKSVARQTAKLCIPAPSTLHYRGGRKFVSEKAYPDMEEFWSDFVAAYRAEIADLIAAGCTYLQIDEVAFAYLCDDEIRARVRDIGEDPDALIAKYVDVLNAITTGWPETFSVTLHTCRGNFRGLWRASGSYAAVAEHVFGRSEVDGLFLEFDTERAGGFEPLRYVRKGTRVALGLISTKVPELESTDDLKRRVEEASRYVPIENLTLCPQCGFSSSHLPNPATNEDVQWRKIALMVETANEIWGSS